MLDTVGATAFEYITKMQLKRYSEECFNINRPLKSANNATPIFISSKTTEIDTLDTTQTRP